MEQTTIPKRFITSIFPIISFAIDKGIEPNTVLYGTGLNEKHLLDSNTSIEMEQELRMIRNLSDQYPHKELPWELGRYYHAKAHGIIGSLIVNAPTLGDAYEIILEYTSLSHTFFRVYTETTHHAIRIFPIENDLPPDLLPFLIERDIAATLTVIDDLFPGKKNGIIRSVFFSHSPRTDIKRYQELLFINVSFNQPSTFIELNKSALSLPVPGSNKQAFELFRQQCQAEYYLRGGKRIHLSDRVRLCLQVEKGRIKLTEIADKLRINEKSLRRQLHREGTSFLKIKQDYILHQTINLLQDSSTSIGEIAEKMGYSETCAFTRAFQRQTGMTPSTYRKVHFS